MQKDFHIPDLGSFLVIFISQILFTPIGHFYLFAESTWVERPVNWLNPTQTNCKYLYYDYFM